LCRIYNKVGSLTTLKLRLEENNIHDFKSLKEVMDFQKNYPNIRQELICHHENLIKEEKNKLEIDLPSLNLLIEIQRQQTIQRLTNEIDKLTQRLIISTSKDSKNYFQKFSKNLNQWNYKRKINGKEYNFEAEVTRSISDFVNDHRVKSDRYQLIKSDFNQAVEESSRQQLLDLEVKNSTISQLNNFIHGALGEQQVVKTLETLSDEYFLINDFAVSFSPAIYNRQENDYIQSVQIDHILVGPSGIFIIETKNWNQKSLDNISLRSPVAQIKRTSFVLYYLLNNESSHNQIGLDMHHWGDRKIPIKNLIVFTNTKPKEEFQYVKILITNELLGYVNYFDPIFSYDETKKIADMILRINDSNK
jgi:hypothetical protein